MTPALEYIFGARLFIARAFFLQKDMKKILIYTLIVVAFLSLDATTIRAQISSASSATLKSAAGDPGYDYRVENLRNFLEKYDSPLAPYAQDFVMYADTNGLDYRLVPAISGVESTFGKFIPVNSFNAYGWANGHYSFTSWEDSIAHVSETLEKFIYRQRCANHSQNCQKICPSLNNLGKRRKILCQQNRFTTSKL